MTDPRVSLIHEELRLAFERVQRAMDLCEPQAALEGPTEPLLLPSTLCAPESDAPQQRRRQPAKTEVAEQADAAEGEPTAPRPVAAAGEIRPATRPLPAVAPCMGWEWIRSPRSGEPALLSPDSDQRYIASLGPAESLNIDVLPRPGDGPLVIPSFVLHALLREVGR